MSEREFRLRLNCTYTAPDNHIADLHVEVLTGNGWEDLVLHLQSPGFLMFVYTIFTCQHLYLRTNCAEKGFVLRSAQGAIRVVTDEDWNLRVLDVEFAGVLDAGEPSEADIAYIIGRMRQCPVSRNLREQPVADTRLSLRRA